MELYNYTVSEALKELASLTGQDYRPRSYEKRTVPQRPTTNQTPQNPKDQIRKIQTLQNPRPYRLSPFEEDKHRNSQALSEGSLLHGERDEFLFRGFRERQWEPTN